MRLPTHNPHYEVDEEGNVWSTKYGSPRKMKAQVSKSGYESVMIMPECRWYKVHRLVAVAFIPNPDNLPYVNHKDGNKLNNRPDNLEWVTKAQNQQHAAANGLLRPAKGESHFYAKLSESDVLEIRKRFKSGSRTDGARAIGRDYGLHHSSVMAIIEGDSWKHLT